MALAVLVAAPLLGISSRGLGGYLHSYVEPNVIMLPFNIIGEFSRGVSLAIRLIRQCDERRGDRRDPAGRRAVFFPVVMDMLGLLTGVVQAYIFAILAIVYISSATTPPDSSSLPAQEQT